MLFVKHIRLFRGSGPDDVDFIFDGGVQVPFHSTQGGRFYHGGLVLFREIRWDVDIHDKLSDHLLSMVIQMIHLNPHTNGVDSPLIAETLDIDACTCTQGGQKQTERRWGGIVTPRLNGLIGFDRKTVDHRIHFFIPLKTDINWHG